MKTTASFNYPAFALFVLACFALSPQAFATQVEPVRFTPASAPACSNSVSVTLSAQRMARRFYMYLERRPGK